MEGGADLLHIASLARRVILEDVMGGVCGFVFIEVRKATLKLIVLFSVRCWILHP